MIRYSGYPVYYQEFLLNSSVALANFMTQLVNAGWTLIRSLTVSADSVTGVGGGPGYVLQSRKTPQGLQCRLMIWTNGTNLWFRFMTSDETLRQPYPSYLVMRNDSAIRIIANPYQFFTFKYNNTLETGNCIMGGVPWIPSFLQPFVIASATNSSGSTVDVTLLSTHPYQGDLVTIDGALGVSGLNGTFNASRIGPSTLRLSAAQISGSYTANSAVLAGPDRIARLIWSQAQAYSNTLLFSNPSRCFRYRLDATPTGSPNLGNLYSNNSAILNQYSWAIPNDFSFQDLTGAVKILKPVPNLFRWYDGSYFAHEPFLMMGESTGSNEGRVCAQIWDAIVANQNFGQLDKTVTFDGYSWLVYTSVNDIQGVLPEMSPDGALLLRISNL